MDVYRCAPINTVVPKEANLFQDNKLRAAVEFVFLGGTGYPVIAAIDQAGFPEAFPFQTFRGDALGDHVPHGGVVPTPGERQVRALFVTGGNPLITMPNAGRLKRAFGELELLVTLDIYRNETGSLAHYTLPCTSPLERPEATVASSSGGSELGSAYCC